MPYRVTYNFQLQGDRLAGWSENYWNNLTDISAVMTNAMALGNRLVQSKGYGVLCPSIRYSIPGSPRSAITVINTPALSSGTGPLTSVYTPDYQQTKWLLKIAGPKVPFGQVGSGVTTQWFGGITDASVVGGYLQRGVLISVQFPLVIAQLTGAGLGWCIYTLATNVLPVPIVSINNTTGVVTTQGAHGIPDGGLVRISRIRNLTYANGLWKITVNPGANNQFTLNNWVAQMNVMSTSPKGNVRYQTYQAYPIQGVTVPRSSNHRAGRPTGQFGGRRKKTASH